MSGSIRHSNAYTMGKESKAAKFVNDQTHIHEPSPSKYLPVQKDGLSVAVKQPSFSFPKEKEAKRLGKEPGPGEYVIPSKIVEQPQYSMRKKVYPNLQIMKTHTGPGDYNPQVGQKQLKYSISALNKSQVILGQPGPGSYENEHALHYSKISGSKMGKEYRKAEFLKTASAGKPSAAYNLHPFTNDPKAGVAKYSFSKNNRFAPKEEGKFAPMTAPGPGQYEAAQPLVHGKPKYSMPGRRKDLRPKTGVGVPQADHYNPASGFGQIHRSSSNYSISKSRRDGELGVFPKGPGCTAYNPQDNMHATRSKASTWRIGSENRPRQQQYVPPTPGPGCYETRSTPGKGHSQYSMGKRSLMLNKLTPGPGAYEHRVQPVQQAAPKFSMGGDKRIMLNPSSAHGFTVINQNPGSGMHEPTHKLVKPSGPNFGFGTSTRDDFKPKMQPGPGYYNHIQEVGNANDRSLTNKIQV